MQSAGFIAEIILALLTNADGPHHCCSELALFEQDIHPKQLGDNLFRADLFFSVRAVFAV
jgi:hypothetical protein